ncbi:hypothetical protein J2Z66_001006 [Paenibacillus eucommiae]|uniref:Uncharacterized protein n=1 Tax=Paenibacillus eucommiae TaxID=1355755 RepID=A0ABS4IR87_9BACL|nr:hypothetical protein [Paenibacillus eucommiae]
MRKFIYSILFFIVSRIDYKIKKTMANARSFFNILERAAIP